MLLFKCISLGPAGNVLMDELSHLVIASGQGKQGCTNKLSLNWNWMAFSRGFGGSERETAFHRQWTTQELEFSMQNRCALTNRNQCVLEWTAEVKSFSSLLSVQLLSLSSDVTWKPANMSITSWKTVNQAQASIWNVLFRIKLWQPVKCSWDIY